MALRRGGRRGCLHGVLFLGLFGAQQPDGDEVQWADEAVAHPEAAGAGDGVAQRNGPVVFEEQHGCRRVLRYVLYDVPRVRFGEHIDAIGGRFRAGDGADLGTLFSRDPETDEGGDLASQLDRLVLGEVAEMLDLDLALAVLVDSERIDDANGVALAQP